MEIIRLEVSSGILVLLSPSILSREILNFKNLLFFFECTFLYFWVTTSTGILDPFIQFTHRNVPQYTFVFDLCCLKRKLKVYENRER